MKKNYDSIKRIKAQLNSLSSFSTSLSSKTLTSFCLFNLGSLDQIDALLYNNDKANKGMSFLCGDVLLASSKNCSYSDFGSILTNFSKSLINSSNSVSLNPANFIKSFLISNNSSFVNSGVIGFTPLSQRCLNNSLTLPLPAKANNTFVSMTKNIYNNPCFLAILSLSFSPSINACSSVSLDLVAIFSNLLNAISLSNLSFKEVSTPLAIISGRSFSKSIFPTSFLASFSTPLGTSNSNFITSNYLKGYINVFDCSVADITDDNNVTNSSFLGIYERETSLPGYFFLADWNASTSLPLTATNLLSTTAMYFPEYFFDNSCECLNKKSSCILSTYCNYKSSYLNLLEVNYTDDTEGKTTYLFSNTTDNNYGLQSMLKPWIVLMNYQANDQPLFVTTSRKTLSAIPLKVTATEDEKITKLTFNQSFSSNTNLTLAFGYLGIVNTRSDTG